MQAICFSVYNSFLIILFTIKKINDRYLYAIFEIKVLFLQFNSFVKRLYEFIKSKIKK